MKDCIKDCLSCSNSFSIAKEDSGKAVDELYCSEKDCLVNEDGYCEEYN